MAGIAQSWDPWSEGTDGCAHDVKGPQARSNEGSIKALVGWHALRYRLTQWSHTFTESHSHFHTLERKVFLLMTVPRRQRA